MSAASLDALATWTLYSLPTAFIFMLAANQLGDYFWSNTPDDRRDLTLRLAELLVAPIPLTPGLALIGSATQKGIYAGIVLMVFGLGGALLGRVYARYRFWDAGPQPVASALSMVVGGVLLPAVTIGPVWLIFH